MQLHLNKYGVENDLLVFYSIFAGTVCDKCVQMISLIQTERETALSWAVCGIIEVHTFCLNCWFLFAYCI